MYNKHYIGFSKQFERKMQLVHHTKDHAIQIKKKYRTRKIQPLRRGRPRKLKEYTCMDCAKVCWLFNHSSSKAICFVKLLYFTLI